MQTLYRSSAHVARLSFLLAAALLQSPFDVHATPGPSPYFLNHPKWRCDEMIAEFKRIPELALPILLDTPGNDLDCFDRLVKLPNLKKLELHVINETCFPERGRRCQQTEVPYGYSINSWKAAIRKRDSQLVRRIQTAAARAAALTKKIRNDVQLFISPLLESNLNVDEAEIVFGIVRPYFSGRPVTWVWNPVNDVGRVSGTHYERHGFNPKLSAPCIYNNDGSIFEPVQASFYLAKYAQCDIAAFWTVGDNGNDKRYTSAEGFVEVPKRVGFNRSREFRNIADAVLRRTGPAPIADALPIDLKGCKEVRRPPDGEKRGFIWKETEPSNSGRLCGGKPANGAVAITEQGKGSRALVAVRAGKVIESFCNSGEYAHDPAGRRRRLWRSNKSVPTFPAGTVLKSDSNVCWVLKNPAERID